MEGAMAFAFDTLGYAKKLRSAGVPQDQAEAHAEAAREFVMAELVTRHDVEVVRNDLDGKIDVLRREMEAGFDNLSLRITVRMGVMIAAGVAVLATIIQLS
jgi:hypothetical protein